MRQHIFMRFIVFTICVLATVTLAGCGNDSSNSNKTPEPKTVQITVTGDGANSTVFKKLQQSLPAIWQLPEDDPNATADYEIRINTTTRSRVCKYANWSDITTQTTDATIQLVQLESGKVIDEREFTGTLACPTQLNGSDGSQPPKLLSIQTWAFSTLSEHTGQALRIQSHERLISGAIIDMHPTTAEFLFSDQDKELSVGDAATLEKKFGLTAQKDSVLLTAAYSPDGRWIAGGYRDGMVHIWDSQTGHDIQQFSHQQQVTSVQFSADSTRLAVMATESTVSPDDQTEVVVWDIATGDAVYRYDSEAGLKQITISQDNHLAISDYGAQIRIINLNAPDNEPVLIDHRQVAQAITFTPDNTHLMTYAGMSVQLWDIATGEQTLQINLITLVQSAQLSPDGKSIITTYQTGQTNNYKIVFWDTATGDMQREILYQHHINTAEFSPNGRYVIGYGDSTLWMWDAATGQPLYWLLGHGGWVKSALFTPDYDWLISSGNDYLIRQWDTSALAAQGN